MPRFVALLRGVNVGKGKRVPMAELRQLLAALAKTLHVDVPVIVKSSSDIAAIQMEITLASKSGRSATTRNWFRPITPTRAGEPWAIRRKPPCSRWR